jgi:hypothetical protein
VKAVSEQYEIDDRVETRSQAGIAASPVIYCMTVMRRCRVPFLGYPRGCLVIPNYLGGRPLRQFPPFKIGSADATVKPTGLITALTFTCRSKCPSRSVHARLGGLQAIDR